MPVRRFPIPGPSLAAARTTAHRLAMAPFAFQAAMAARELGVLAALATPACAAQVGRLTGLPATSIAVLLDACLAIELVAEIQPDEWALTTVGTVWLRDPQVAIDSEFSQTMC